jgi:hypothetical protein
MKLFTAAAAMAIYSHLFFLCQPPLSGKKKRKGWESVQGGQVGEFFSPLQHSDSRYSS